MKSWLILLGGPILWAVHFFGLYALAEFAPANVPMLLLSLLCITGNMALLYRFAAMPADPDFLGWRRYVGLGGAVLSLVAVVWQTLVLLLR